MVQCMQISEKYYFSLCTNRVHVSLQFFPIFFAVSEIIPIFADDSKNYSH